MIITITDEPKARTRRKTFHYMMDGGLLRHVSAYATSKYERGTNRGYKVNYDLPKESIQGKQVYRFSFKNSGGFGGDMLSYSDITSTEYSSGQAIELNDYLNIKFEVTNSIVDKQIKKIYNLFLPMVNDINTYKGKMDLESVYSSERVNDFINGNVHYGLASCLCNWPEKSRVKSLDQISKLLHQLWTFKILHDTLRAIKIEKKGWYTEQGKPNPVSIFIDSNENLWTCWYELERISEAPPDYSGPMATFFEGNIVWKRPDIVITKGKYDTALEAPNFTLLIECKHSPFDNWWLNGKVMEKELLPYKILFKPQNPILASLGKIPDWAKREIEGIGYNVVDELYYGGSGISQLKRLFEKLI